MVSRLGVPILRRLVCFRLRLLPKQTTANKTIKTVISWKNWPKLHGKNLMNMEQSAKQMESFNIFMSIKSLTHVCFPEDKEDDESIIKSNQIRDLKETAKDICLFNGRLLVRVCHMARATHERTNLRP